MDLVRLLREMDRTQRETDESGGTEVAWYYYRDQIEDLLGLSRGALDSSTQVAEPGRPVRDFWGGNP